MSNESTVLRDKVFAFVTKKATTSVLQFGIESKRIPFNMKSVFAMFKDILDINSRDKIGTSLMIYYPSIAYGIQNQEIENELSVDVANIVNVLKTPTASIKTDYEICFAIWMLQLFYCQMNKMFDQNEFQVGKTKYATFRSTYFRQDLVVMINTVDAMYLFSESSVSTSESSSSSKSP